MEEDFLRRIDEHMARGNEAMGEVREAMRLSREQHADLRRFVEEQTLRAERIADRQVTALDTLVRRQDEAIATMHDMRQEMRLGFADGRDESRAQRVVLLRLIDRLDERD